MELGQKSVQNSEILLVSAWLIHPIFCSETPLFSELKIKFMDQTFFFFGKLAYGSNI